MYKTITRVRKNKYDGHQPKTIIKLQAQKKCGGDKHVCDLI